MNFDMSTLGLGITGGPLPMTAAIAAAAEVVPPVPASVPTAPDAGTGRKCGEREDDLRGECEADLPGRVVEGRACMKPKQRNQHTQCFPRPAVLESHLQLQLTNGPCNSTSECYEILKLLQGA